MKLQVPGVVGVSAEVEADLEANQTEETIANEGGSIPPSSSGSPRYALEPAALDDVARFLEESRIHDDVAVGIAEVLSVGPVKVSYRPATAEAGVKTEIGTAED